MFDLERTVRRARFRPPCGIWIGPGTKRTHKLGDIADATKVIELADFAARRAIPQAQAKQVRHSTVYRTRINVAVVSDWSVNEGIVDSRNRLVDLSEALRMQSPRKTDEGLPTQRAVRAG